MAGGLSTSTFLDGAMRGYNFMQDHEDTNRRRAREDTLVERQDIQFQNSQEDRSSRLAREEKMGERGDLLFDQNQEDRTRNHKREDSLDAQKKTRFNQENSDRSRKISREDEIMRRQDKQYQISASVDYLGSLLAYEDARKAGQDAATTPEQKRILGQQGIPAPDILLGKKGEQAAKAYEQLKSGDLDGGLRSPEASQALLTVFPEINARANHGKKIIGAYIIPDQDPEYVTIALKIKGQKNYEGLTHNRSADQDDNVMKVRTEDLMSRFENFTQMRNTMKSPAGITYLRTLHQELGQVDRTMPKKGRASTANFTKDRIQFEKSLAGSDSEYGHIISQIQSEKDPAKRKALIVQKDNYVQSQWQTILDQSGNPISAGTQKQVPQKAQATSGDGSYDLGKLTKFQSQKLAEARKLYPDRYSDAQLLKALQGGSYGAAD